MDQYECCGDGQVVEGGRRRRVAAGAVNYSRRERRRNLQRRRCSKPAMAAAATGRAFARRAAGVGNRRRSARGCDDGGPLTACWHLRRWSRRGLGSIVRTVMRVRSERHCEQQPQQCDKSGNSDARTPEHGALYHDEVAKRRFQRDGSDNVRSHQDGETSLLRYALLRHRSASVQRRNTYSLGSRFSTLDTIRSGPLESPECRSRELSGNSVRKPLLPCSCA